VSAVRVPPLPPPATWLPLVERALAEDVGSGDATAAAVLAANASAAAVIEARAPLVACGLPIARAVFAALDATLRVEACEDEGARVEAGRPLLTLAGSARAILAGERTALNFLGRLAGVATHTRRYVDAVAGTGVEILDTRKTLPGWRLLDKYAVAVGGGRNHRFGLYDALLIKDNHIAAAGGVKAALEAARAHAPSHLRIQIEVENEAQAQEAVDAGARWLLLDNQSPAQLRALAARFRERAVLEASGGVTLANVREIAETGVHRISVGALTHSAPNADVALELRGEARR
jgi:nicotinate-nucleotide pyrophosphorylase (carboxylating)